MRTHILAHLRNPPSTRTLGQTVLLTSKTTASQAALKFVNSVPPFSGATELLRLSADLLVTTNLALRWKEKATTNKRKDAYDSNDTSGEALHQIADAQRSFSEKEAAFSPRVWQSIWDGIVKF